MKVKVQGTILALNSFEIVQGEQAYLPFVLVDKSGSPFSLSPWWTKVTFKINTKPEALTKVSTEAAQVYVYYSGPGAVCILKLEPEDTRLLTSKEPYDVQIQCDMAYPPGNDKQIFIYSKSLWTIAPPVPA